MTPPRMVYMAYPIDLIAGRDDVRPLFETIENLKPALMDAGVDIIFDPGDAFMVNAAARVGHELRSINQAALDAADAMVAVLPSGLPSIGVPMEIDHAVKQGKTVAVMTDTKAWMLGFGDYPNVKTFPIEEAGWVQMILWMVASHLRVEESKQIQVEALPFQRAYKAECGKYGVHDAHDYGEHMADRCDGVPDCTPRRVHHNDAGWDLIVAETTLIRPGQQVDIPMGVAVALPEWSFGRITGRSSTLRKLNVLVNEGIIDAGYRGPLYALCRNMGTENVRIDAGSRVAQLIIHENHAPEVEPVAVLDLPESTRGDRGFGSTGT